MGNMMQRAPTRLSSTQQHLNRFFCVPRARFLGVTPQDIIDFGLLLWITRGKSNRDVAEILNLSPRTVNKHLEQIYAKLGVENRTAAAALAMQTLGLR